MQTKEEILLEWLGGCEALTQKPLLLWLGEHEGSCAIVPIPADRQQDFIADIYRRVTLDFMLEIRLPLSEYTDLTNADSLFSVSAWQDWIDEQEVKGNYPDFGRNCGCYELKNLSEAPQFAEACEDGTGVFSFPVRLVYLEERYK